MKKYLNKQVRKALDQQIFMPINKLFSPFFSGIGSVVMLHRVVAHEDDILCEDLEVTAEYLESVIQYFLKANYEILSLNVVYEILAGNRKTAKKFVVFTFDDGYEDNYSLAYPLFKKYDVPFTVYVATSFPDQTALLWWYALKDLVNERQHIRFTFQGNVYDYALESTDQKTEAYSDIRQLILSLDAELQQILFEIIFIPAGIELARYSQELAMSWGQVKEMAADRLVTIGAHTTNHFNLRNLAPETVQKEIGDSKKRIEFMANTKVEHFAFPFGTLNEASDREFQIAENLGFKTSTTTRCGNIFPQHAAHLNCLPRITPSPHLITTFPQFYASGFIPALKQKFKRVVTN
ncbi:polysaccharide deacetylase family protein [Planococcus sp. APC 3906]|uniref:polysaccharide deacetylase family protein n=1 Tax=Planococcus sp. APC 3906 TaxID=3035194 RepID=UPI0025B47791|nr:polysaccharide deacetylase family protein [Planococcus sp. APC 3906]MDN3450106.1 polysaccharide deacetylase family protein [Planococcus sp. APC 3906]